MRSGPAGWTCSEDGQSARTIHFIAAWLIVAFVLVHVFEVIVSGFWNHLRSMITGGYRVPPEASHGPGDRARRRFFARTLAAASALALAGCERLSHSDWFPRILGAGEKASSAALRFVAGRKAMAQEFTPADLSPGFRSNGTAEPDTDAYRALMAADFSDYRLEVGGLVARPLSLSLDELKAFPSRTQITRHDCVEGWSAIAKWQGAPSSMRCWPPRA